MDVTRSIMLSLLKETNVLVYDMIPLMPTFAKHVSNDGSEDFHFKDGQYFHVAQVLKSVIEMKDFIMFVLVPRPSVVNIDELLHEFHNSVGPSSPHAKFQEHATALAQTMEIHIRDQQCHAERHEKLAEDNDWQKVVQAVEEHRMWMKGNSPSSSAIDTPTDSMVVENRPLSQQFC